MSFAYGLGLPHWQPLSGGFSPAGLFQAGVIGTFYDPSDPTTLFTTSTGTTPCAVPGSGSQVLVGLMLDKSQGAPGALGAELLADPGFDNAASWQSNAGVAISGGEAIWNTATNSVYVRQPLITAANTYYEFTVVCSSYTAGTVFVGIGAGGTNLTSFPINAVGTVSFRTNVGANSGTVWLLTPTGGAQLSITSFSVKQVLGNHAIAFNDTTARPELSARVNLLTYSEQFDNAAWTKITSGTGSIPAVTPNAGIAPDGTNTADLVVFNRGAGNTASDYSWLYQSVNPTIASVSYTGIVYFKAATAGDVGKTLQFRHVSGAGVTITLTENWQTISVAQNAAGASGSIDIINRGGSTTGNSVSVLLWGADLRVTNIGSAIPSYQRIADQYTYDSNGFPSYLRFDGVDDSMYTPASINFSGTDKMSVFAGVRKLSDAARAMLTELSATTSNPGTFSIEAPAAAAARFDFYSTGTVGAGANAVGAAYAAPITAVLTGVSDISAPVATLRINGTQAATNTTSQGTGNYGTYPLFIGSRNNASLRFNGYLYSLIVAGAQLESGSITATEQYVAGKTGVQI